jgi:hypothetical protein
MSFGETWLKKKERKRKKNQIVKNHMVYTYLFRISNFFFFLVALGFLNLGTHAC